jgi:phosphate starvation-inducible PhoH-like protein
LKQNTNKTAFVEKLTFTNQDLLKNLCGEHDKHLKLIEKLEPVKVKAWGTIFPFPAKKQMSKK